VPPDPTPTERRQLIDALLAERGVRPAAAPPVPRGEADGPPPLSLAQEGLWVVEQLHPGLAHSSIPGALRLLGRLDVPALARSLGEIVRRHESLRTTFGVGADGSPHQVIGEPRETDLPMVDLSARSGAERRSEALRLATEEASRPFDLAKGPLLRAFLVRLAAEEHVFVLNIHHIVCDGWSMGVLTRELGALYAAFSAGRPSPLPELPIQFRDAAGAERRALAGGELARRVGFWRERLARRPLGSELPPDRPRPPVPSLKGRHQPVRLPPELSEALRAFSRREKATLFMTLQAAMAVLLHHRTGDTDVVLGATLANRDRPELEPLIGYFTTMLPLRTDLSGEPTFRDVLARVRRAVLEASAHALPLPVLVSELSPERDPGKNPFFQVELTLLTPDHNPAVYGYGLAEVREERTIAGLTMAPLAVEGGVARFDVSLFLWDLSDGIQGAAEYATDLYEPSTIVQLLSRLEALLGRVVVDAGVSVRDLGAANDAEERAEGARPPETRVESLHRRLQGARRRPVPLALSGEPSC